MADEQHNWEREALGHLLAAHLREQRRARIWSLVFKSLGFVWLFLLLILIFSRDDGDFVSTSPHTALIEIQGEIGGEDGVIADDLIGALNSAFEAKHVKGVVLRINSPGGSPVQAGQIYDEIRRLREKHPDIPLYAVVEDVCASGGYYIAAASDRIYVDKASLVGSIGVLMDQFGFVETLEKLGVERRVLAAGENKAFLDPFSPLQPAHVEHARKLLSEIHLQFIDVVRKGRGARLKESPELFSGLLWSGARSIELGLSDGYGTVDYVAREVIKAEQIVEYTRKENLLDRLAKRFGAAVTESIALGGAGAVRLR